MSDNAYYTAAVRLRQVVSERVSAGLLEGSIAKLASGRVDHRTLMRRMRTVDASVECPHNPSHILTFVRELLRLDPVVPGVIVEAGCFKGGSTAKFSLVAGAIGRELVVFDSFEGLPANDEDHVDTLAGTDIRGWFDGGNFAGTLDEVRANVERYGDPTTCRFIPGWFDDTMPRFDEPIAAAYLDVDLAQSTRTCLEHLWPRISPGGVLVSQDGDFPLVIEEFRSFADREEVKVEGLGRRKMLRVVKGERR